MFCREKSTQGCSAHIVRKVKQVVRRTNGHKRKVIMNRIAARANFALQSAVGLGLRIIHARSARTVMVGAIVGRRLILVLALIRNQANLPVFMMMMRKNREESQARDGYRNG